MYKTYCKSGFKPCFMDTSLSRTVFFVPGKSPYIVSKFNLLNMDTRYVENGFD